MINQIPALQNGLQTNVIATVRRDTQSLAGNTAGLQQQAQERAFTLQDTQPAPPVGENDNFVNGPHLTAINASFQSNSAADIFAHLNASDAYLRAGAYTGFAPYRSVSFSV